MASAPTASAPSAKAPTAIAVAEAADRCATSEREPVALVAVDLILRIHAGAQADARAHRRKRHPATALVVDAQSGNEIEGTFHAREALEQAAIFAKVVDQSEAFGGVAADVKAHRRPLPIALHGFALLADQPARTITQADNKGGGAFIALDIG